MSKRKKIAFVIAHFHPEGDLSNHLFDHVRYLHHLSGNITFVSTRLNLASEEKLKPYANILVRQNKGYDFYSYKMGLNSIQNIGDVDHLIFFNSSFVTFDPKKLYKKYLSGIYGDGFYGITSCSAPQYHIQSYFFSFVGKKLIESEVFLGWWRRLKSVDNRQTVIQRYEVGMTQWFLMNNVHVKSMYKLNFFVSLMLAYKYLRLTNFNLPRILRSIKRYYQNKNLSIMNLADTLNPTHFSYDHIYKLFGIVKVDLLTKNPTNQMLDPFIKHLTQKNNHKISDIKFEERK